MMMKIVMIIIIIIFFIITIIILNIIIINQLLHKDQIKKEIFENKISTIVCLSSLSYSWWQEKGLPIKLRSWSNQKLQIIHCLCIMLPKLRLENVRQERFFYISSAKTRVMF